MKSFQATVTKWLVLGAELGAKYYGFEHGLSWFLFRGLQHFGVDFGTSQIFWTSLFSECTTEMNHLERLFQVMSKKF